MLPLKTGNRPRIGMDDGRWCERPAWNSVRSKIASGVFSAFLLAACHAEVLDPRGPVGKADRIILIDSLAIMLAIVVPTIMATLLFAWWYRASNVRAQYLPEWKFSGRIELVVWAIPLMVIILLGGVTWIASHELDPAKPLASKTPPLEIQVVSLDWKWLFIYPKQHVASVNQLTVPAGVPLHFSLTSASVLNAFFVPQLGSMIYTMNGMVTQLNLQADAPGTFRGLSAHYSGAGFSDMHFDVRAVSANEFSAWIEASVAEAPQLDVTSYAMLAKPSVPTGKAIYRSTDPELFEKIVMQNLTFAAALQTAHPRAPEAAAAEQ